MKKNNFFLLLVCFSLFSCHQKTQESLVSKWSKKHNPSSVTVVKRKLASNPRNQCLKDIFTIDVLKAEINELESQYSGSSKVRGKWRHLDLSQLPIPQANFLLRFGNQIGDLGSPDSIDYSSCNDVPCIFNRIYGKEESIAGYVHYIWYLKFGHLLSADNVIPNDPNPDGSPRPVAPGKYNGKTFSLSAFLYNEQELYAFWRLSYMLKTPHTTLNYLKEIQRLPRGEHFEGGKDWENVCGLASSSGWIKLQDGCLTFDNDPDKGYFYQSVTHEMSHQVDMQEGKGFSDFWRSNKQDYIDVSGLELTEFVDDKGVPQKKWALKSGANAVSPYAVTNPQENFAETLAVFRTDGDRARANLSSEHFSFTSTNYYQNRSFETNALIEDWSTKNVSRSSKDILKIMIDCNKDPGNQQSNYFVSSDFPEGLSQSFINCISAGGENLSSSIRASVLMREPEGCNTLNSQSKDKWSSVLKAKLISAFSQYLVELQNDKDYLNKMQEKLNQLSDKTLAYDTYLDCYGSSNEVKCYDQEITKAANDIAASLKFSADQSNMIAQQYKAQFTYEEVSAEVTSFYQTMVSSQLDSIKKASYDLWRNCRDIPQNDDDRPKSGIFALSNGYLISSFNNCLNSKLPDELKSIVHSLVEGEGVQNPKEEAVLLKMVDPKVISFLKEFYEKDKAKEEIAAREFLQNDDGGMRKTLLKDLNWITSVIDPSKILSDCKKQFYKKVSLQPLYHLPSELFSDYAEKNSCYQIQSTPEFSKWLETSKSKFQGEAMSVVEQKLIEAASQRAQVCIQNYPVNNIIVRLKYRKDREACLINNWSEIETKAISLTQNDPIVKKLEVPEADLRQRLTAVRGSAQDQIMRKYFSLF